jgi:predicted aspartyl protease
MPRMTVPLGADEPTIPLLVGVNGGETTRLLQAGLPVTPPVLVQAVIDTGATTSNVSARIAHRLGLTPHTHAKNQTVGGVVKVNLYRVSVGLPPVFGFPNTTVLEDMLEVAELPAALPGVEFLLGMDVLRRCVLTVNGPAGTVSLDV